VVYDFDKYRCKREKVLGVKRRTISFAQLTVIFTLVFFISAGAVILPKAVSFFSNRNLDDVIFRLENKASLTGHSLESVMALPGVTHVHQDGKKKRIIITYNRQQIQVEKISKALKNAGQDVVLLNTVGHSQRLKTLAEEARFETI
jgi:hypothetical protein